MGLDTVELVMEIEDTFGITFPDAAAEHCRTVNDVALFVYGRIQEPTTACSHKSRGALRFEELCRAIAEYTKVSPDSLTPETRIDVAIPRNIRRALWARSKMPLPELHRPEWARAIIGFTVFGAFILFFAIYAVFFVRDTSEILVFVAISVVPVVLVTLLFRPFKRELPLTVQTLNDLAGGEFRSNQNREPLSGEPTFPQVLLRIRQITADQMGFPIEKVLPHSRFVEYLEMD